MNPVRSIVRVTSSVVVAVAALSIVVSTVSAASPPYQVKNIRPGAKSSSPSNLAAVGNRLFFSATDGSHGREPFVSDGSSLGTHMIKNLAPGSYNSNPASFTGVGGLVFFTAADGAHGRELWVTDGTAIGTVLVKDIRPGRKSSAPAELTAVGSTLFFTANDGATGRELWTSNGTAAGTVLVGNLESAVSRRVRPISPRSPGSSSSPGHLPSAAVRSPRRRSIAPCGQATERSRGRSRSVAEASTTQSSSS